MCNKRSKKGENISDYEYEVLRNKCPNCLVGEVFEVSNVGLSTDYRCAYCGQGYNLFLGENIKNIGIDENWINIKYQREKKLKNLENETD